MKGTYKVYYKQECKNCKTACNPYRVEDVKCPKCGKPAKECHGMCDDSDDDYGGNSDYDSDDGDSKKPHRADLCQKCRSGWPCR
ncbi:zygote arrest protein 1-like isoform X2 [Mizuhopecten yessoensis]|uniref:zygote arrest protein 1-like isoform X1 n=1 Tax=Mizuhopecten yessoensis TaxID=6573 RepID=UPI000B45B891|nr:zygote arrest protein 1-like isoform X1 [Mizuhopecten yessoensis]XP_021339796.1 zygote arrest protein 1-like isoform X2 [Mizuhopecten yessoensis]